MSTVFPELLESTSGGRWRVVALGGGHGLAATLAALRGLPVRITAVVTVGDDGGSSGRLRGECAVMPPGDLRKAVSALCADDEPGRRWRELLECRYNTEGPLNHHTLGNLMLLALWQLRAERSANPYVAGLDELVALTNAGGRVLPMANVPLDIVAQVRGLHPADLEATMTVRGQTAVATTPGTVVELALYPENPPVDPQVLDAIGEADWVIIGPGSWYTSVICHLLVPAVAQALRQTPARRCLTMNLSPQEGETAGMGAYAHLAAFAAHAPQMHLDAVLADPSAVEDASELGVLAAKMGARVIMRQVRTEAALAQHDPVRLATAYRSLFADV